MSTSNQIAANTVLLDKYRVERVLGEGGWGVVVQARHIVLDEMVAIKLLTAVEIDDEMRARFVREARAAAKLKSEHVVRVTDADEHEGVPYMVMELLDGCDLQHLIKQGPVAPGLLCTLAVQVCSALAEAHGLGIVHRDIKSSNLFVTTRDGRPHAKVLDFGIAKAPEAIDFSLTRTSSILGTPAFMSPEQLRSAHRVDERTDIWSLGVVLFEALEGELPFVADTFSELVLKIAIDPTPPLRNCPAGLDAVILRCLEKDPAKRYRTVAELAVALEPWATGTAALVDRIQRGAFARLQSDPAISVVGATVPAGPVTPIPGPTQRERPARKLPLLVGALGLCAIVGGVVFAITRGRSADENTEPAIPHRVEIPATQPAPAPAPAPAPTPRAEPTGAGSGSAPPETTASPDEPLPVPRPTKPDRSRIKPPIKSPDPKPPAKPDAKPTTGSGSPAAGSARKPCDPFGGIDSC